MNLIEAIVAGDEFRSWMDGIPPITVLLVPPGQDPGACAGRIRDSLVEVGLAVVMPDQDAPDASEGQRAVRLFPGAIATAVGKALKQPGSFALVAGDDVMETAAEILEAARRAQQESRLAGVAIPGRANIDPELQFAIDRIEIIARLVEGPHKRLDLVDGVFYQMGLDQRAAPYEPGKPRGPERRPMVQPSQGPVGIKPASIQADLAQLVAKLRAERRTGFIPIWREGTPEDPHVHDGTCPVTFIPEGMEWPIRKGVHLASILHLDVARMPAPARALLGCETGLFQFFCMRAFDDDMTCFEVRIVDPRGPGTWRAMPDDIAPQVEHENLGPIESRRVITGWREIIDAPCCTEFSEGRMRLTPSQADAVGALQSSTWHEARLPDAKVVAAAERNGLDVERAREVAGLLEHHDSDKLMGWPTWAQAPEWPRGKGSRGMVPFLQLSFDHPDAIAPELIASDGTLQVFVSPQGERRFLMAWACG